MGKTFVVVFWTVVIILGIAGTEAAGEPEKTRTAALFDALKGDAGTRPDAGLKCPIPDGAPCNVGALGGFMRCTTEGNGGCRCECWVKRPPPNPPPRRHCVAGPEQDKPPRRHCTPPARADWYCDNGQWKSGCNPDYHPTPPER